MNATKRKTPIKDDEKFVQRAAGAFMLISVTVKRWDGMARLKAGSRQAALDAGADPDVFNGYVTLMGHHHDDLKRVKALYMAIYTCLYDNALPFERGVYLVPVTRVPELLAKLAEMKKAADTARDNFLLEYDRLIKIAQSDSMGRWAKELKKQYPSAESIRGRFGIEVSPPRAIPATDMSKFGAIPVSMAADIAAANDVLLSEQLSKAKAAAMASAEEHMATVIQQLDVDTVRYNKHGKEINPRFSESLIPKSKQVARMLRDMTQGYDDDPRVIKLADMIDAKISNVQSVETWKTLGSARKESLATARKVHKGITDIQKAAAKAKVTANKSTGKNEPVAFGGVLADLLN